jgi:hypothetical protein
MLTKTVYAKWMAMLHARFARSQNEHVIALYYDTLKELNDTNFERAARHVFDNDQYWPTPKRFIELANGNTREDAINEWHLLLQACATNNTTPALTPAGISAMRAIGGWREVAYAEGEHKQGQLKRAFLESYQAKTEYAQLPSSSSDELILTEVAL